MPRYPMFLAVAASLAAGAVTTAAYANLSPGADNKQVLTNVMLPLSGGAGDVTVQVDPYARKVCYAVNAKAAGSDKLSGGLMKGSASIVAFKNARSGALDGCVDIDQMVAQDIVANPSNYSVSINNGAATATLNATRNIQ